MPRVSVYLPDDLYAAAKAHDLPVSALAQQAIEEALRERSLAAWLEDLLRQGPLGVPPIDTHAALDAGRDDYGA